MNEGICGITDDNLWRPTRRANGHYTKNKLSTRRGAVHSIGWLFGSRAATVILPTTESSESYQNRVGTYSVPGAK
jgi:hypothetical protein